MVKVLAVRPVDRLLVLQALEHDEGRIEEGNRQQDERQHEGHDGSRLDRRLDRDHAHQQPEQVRAAVTHEARCGREVVNQEAERGARGQRGDHPGLLAPQVKGDHRHRRGDDRADSRREAIDAVREVDHVHHHHEPEHCQQRSGVRHAGVGEMQQADEGQRDRLHRNAEMHDDHRRDDLAGELHHGRQLEAVVEGADDRYHRRGQQHATPQFVVFVVAGGQPDEDRDERSGEDRQPSEQRRWTFRKAPLARFVDRAHGPREPHRERRQHRGHGRGGQKGIERFELVRMRHRLAHSIARVGVEKRPHSDGGRSDTAQSRAPAVSAGALRRRLGALGSRLAPSRTSRSCASSAAPRVA
jgi:hypothetical protein